MFYYENAAKVTRACGTTRIFEQFLINIVHGMKHQHKETTQTSDTASLKIHIEYVPFSSPINIYRLIAH